MAGLLRWLGLGGGASPSPEPSEKGWGERRWESADTNRLNAAHWQKARGGTLNEDFVGRLEILRRRAKYEAANNPFVSGVIQTHAASLVAGVGPTLQVLVDNKSTRWGEEVEKRHAEWWLRCDAAGQLSGLEKIQQWVRALWTDGEFIEQMVTSGGRPKRGDVSLRLLGIAPERLSTPLEKMSDEGMVHGVLHDSVGKPLSYWFEKVAQNPLLARPRMDWTTVPARHVVHGFSSEEPGQARGVPWLAPALQTVADLRDYDAQVLDAARLLADMSVYLYSDHPDAEFIEVNEAIPMERRQVSTLPPGWKPFSMTPTHPAATYESYRKERLRELGRPVNMPLMLTLLDSSNHNYSSARLDNQLYQRGLKQLAHMIEVRALNPILRAFVREAEMQELIRQAPEGWRPTWIWPVPPHVDPLKEANAERVSLGNHTLTLQDALAAKGKSLEPHMAQLEREQKMLEAAGLGGVSEESEAEKLGNLLSQDKD